jgi:hypothetical protein
MLFGAGCSEFSREGNFLESKLSGFCSGGIIFMQSTMWVLISCCFVMSGAFLYQSCLTGNHVPKTFELTLNKSAKVLCASSCFIFRRAKLNTAGAKTALLEILLLL